MHSDQYVNHTEQLQQLFTDRFVDLNKERGFIRTLSNPLEASSKDADPLYSLN
jgi:hypothetical protein